MIYSLALLVAGLCEVLGVAALNQMAKSKSIAKIFYFISSIICSLFCSFFKSIFVNSYLVTFNAIPKTKI